MSKLYCTYINHVAIPKNKKQKKIKRQQNKQKQKQDIIATVYITSEDAIRQLL